MKSWQTILILCGFVMLTTAIIFKKPIITQKVEWDLSDREHGICAPMYKEGYDWGLGQFRIDVGLQDEKWRRQEEATGRAVNREERGLYWLHYMEDFAK